MKSTRKLVVVAASVSMSVLSLSTGPAAAAPSSTGCGGIANADNTPGIVHSFDTYGVNNAFGRPAGVQSPIYNGGIYANC